MAASMNCPSTGGGVTLRGGRGPRQDSIRGGRAIRRPDGDDEGIRLGGSDATELDGNAEPARPEPSASVVLSCALQLPTPIPTSSGGTPGGVGDRFSQKRDAGVGKPASVQNS